MVGTAVSLLAARSLPAQTPPKQRAVRTNELAVSLRAIRPFLRSDPQRAILMLERLTEQYPTNSQVLNLLGETYQVAGEADSAIAVYGRCLAAHPTNVRAGAALGTLYIQADQRDKGEAVFNDLISRTRHSVNTYRTIGSTLNRSGHYDFALRMYEEGRRVNTGNYVLTIDIARLHKSMGEFDASLQEYLYMIETSPKHHNLAKNNILELLRDPRADADSLLAELDAAAAVESAYRETVMNVLSLAYREHGGVERALEVALEAEQIGVSDGTVLFNLAEGSVNRYRREPRASKTRYFDLALRALDAFINGHSESPQIPRAKLMLVDLLVDLADGRVESRPGIELETATAQAIEALDWMIASFPGTDHAEQAYLKKGDVVLRIQKQPQEALEIYKEGMSQARFYSTAFAERLGRLYLGIGDYDNAEQYFTRLVNQSEPELREAGIFYSGLLLSMTGQYETARDTLTALAEGNPSSQFTNDAIELAWVIQEGLQGDQKVLDQYIDALEYEVAEDTTRAIEALNSTLDYPADTPLRSRSLFRIGELYQGTGAFDDAVDAFTVFIRDYPADIRVPEAHRRIGQVYERGYNNTALALEKYEDILLSYPHYIFLDEVRDDVTRLRDHTGDQ